MTDDVKALIAEAGEIAQYADEQGHHGASRVIRQLVAALWAATVAPAVDREALIERIDGSALDHFLKSFNGDEAGDIDYVWAEDGNTGWAMRGGNDVASVLLKAFDALLASGLLRDVRDVQAEALEQAADVCERIQNDEEFGGSGAGRIVAAKIVLRSMAEEARSER